MRTSDYAQYATLTQGREVIHGALWDTLLYTSAATTVLNFFQQSVAALSFDVTNMLNPGQLPYPTQFLVRAIRCFLKQRPESWNLAAGIQAGAYENIETLFHMGLLTITHGSKEYGRYPLHCITAGGGAHGIIGTSNILVGGAAVDYAQSGRPHAKDVFTLAKPLLIETSMNFLYQLSWPQGAVTLTRNLNLCLLLEGDLIRPVQ